MNWLLLASLIPAEINSRDNCRNDILNALNFNRVLYITDVGVTTNYSLIGTNLSSLYDLGRQQSYVIEVRNLGNLLNALEALKKMKGWNTYAVIVVIIYEVEDLEDAFRILWTFYLSKVLLLSATLDVYTYYPITPSACGSTTPVLLQSCKTRIKFPNFREPLTFSSCSFRTSFLKLPPFAIGLKLHKYPGLVVTINDELQQRLKYNVTYIQNYTNFGVKLSSGIYTDILADLSSGALDFCWLGMLNNTYMQDFTYVVQFLKNDYYFWVHRAERASVSSNFLLVFSTEAWCGLALTFLLSTFLCSLLKCHETASFRSIEFCVLTLWRIIFTPNSSIPKTWVFRIYILVWTVVVFILASAYNGSIGSFLFIPNYLRQVNTVEKIVDSNFIIGGSYNVHGIYRSLDTVTGRTVAKRLIACPATDTSCVTRAAEQSNFAAVKDSRPVYYYWYDFLDKWGQAKIFRVETGIHSDFVIYLRKGHILEKRFKEMSIRFVQSGLLDYWDKFSKDVRHKGTLHKFRVLKVRDLEYIFLLLIIAHIVSITVYIAEVFYKNYSKIEFCNNCSHLFR